MAVHVHDKCAAAALKRCHPVVLFPHVTVVVPRCCAVPCSCCVRAVLWGRSVEVEELSLRSSRRLQAQQQQQQHGSPPRNTVAVVRTCKVRGDRGRLLDGAGGRAGRGCGWALSGTAQRS